MTTVSRPERPIVLYGFKKSGHSHRVEVFLELLGLPYVFRPVDLAGGEHKRVAFTAKNVFGQVPVIEDGDQVISDSCAILFYLASRYAPESWLPREFPAAADVQRWLSVASGLLAYGAAAARLVTVFKAPFNPEEVIARAHVLLRVMEDVLTRGDWLVGTQPTIADVALYSYVAHAPEGNVSLDAYPHVLGWLARFEALPGFVPMPSTAVGLRAGA
jgi:glutathione S-transferase